MPRIIVTTREGDERRLDVPPGLSVMQAIRDAGIYELVALCGGLCACATCHVYVDNSFIGALPSQEADESGLLEASSHRRETSRLSCQFRLTDDLDGLRVTIAPED
jgi:ferredoxin, 2Fe-2S